MADQILSPLVGKLVDYIAVPVGRQFSYLFRYNGNLEEFRSQLRGLEMAGLDVKLLVEAAERNGEAILPSVEDWLKRVDAVSGESQRFVGEEDAISKCCFNGPLNLKVRYQRSRKAMKKAAEFDRIKKDGRFDSVSVPALPPQLVSMNNENEFDFESRRSVFNEIMDAIKDDGVQMIGIWGMPGIGKTTLVKRVAKYAKDEGLFEEVAMAVVSQNPSVKDIQGQIADRIGLKFTSESEGGRAGQLFQRLDGKKILVILDDIWDSIELNDIGIPSGSQHKGCKIILTSRIRDVCEKMRTGKNFEINLLSEKEALSLFLQNSGIDNQFSEKGRLAENLSEECGRLPICIVIVARGLLNKEQFYWTDMLNRLRNSDPDNKVRAAIELSYDTVKREEEKMFFLLCVLFPEDYEIPVRVLFEYGIGLDLFEKVNNVDEALVRAHKLASSLKSSCLLLNEGSEEFVKMHDVVRDVALAIASEGKNVFHVRSVAQSQGKEWPGKTAISLWSDVKKLPDALECPQLQILMLNLFSAGFHLSDNFFAGMKNLIVLDIMCMECDRLPQSFAGLENLRTLRLNGCSLRDISTIGKLQNLVSLSFRNSDIEVLPKEVGELSNLTLLDLFWCGILKEIAPGVIQNLSQLEVLNMGSNKYASVSELIHLSRLMILEIHIPDASMLPDEVLFGNLTKFKVSIGHIEGSIGDIDLEENIFSSNCQILKLGSLSENELTKAGIKMLMKKAQRLELTRISGISVALPSHLGGFRTLKELIVNDCKDVNYVLDMNESDYEPETPSLQRLHLIDLPFLKELSKGEFPSMFVSELESLWLHRLPRFVHLWKFDAKSVALDNLTFVSVESCDKLEYVFEHSCARSLLKLKNLVVKNCRNLQAICPSKEQDNDIEFPQLSHLKLSEWENLTSFGSKFASESILFGKQVIFRVLETLDIYKLDRLEKIWHIHSPVESFFQLKVLKLTQCPELLVVFPAQATSTLRNLEEIYIENCYKLESLVQLDDVPLTVSNEMILFPRLLTLNLINLPMFTAILSNTSQNVSQVTVIFSAMEIMTLCRLHNLESIKNQQLLTFFPKLKNLQLVDIGHLSLTADQLHIIKGLEALETLKINDNNVKTISKVIATNPKLRKLQLCLIHEPIEWSEILYRGQGFQRLTSLNFFSCKGLKSLLTPSTVNCLMQLEELFVNECEIMESIIGETSGEQNFDKVIEFFKLCTLNLKNLPCLASFYNGECALKFPCLGDISIECCSQLRTFTSMTKETPEPSHKNFVPEALFGQQVSFGRLSHLKLSQVELIEEIWPRDHPATAVGELTDFRLDTCPALRYVFDASVANHLENLESLCVENCSSIVEIVEEKPGRKIMLPLFSVLRLVNLPCFKVNQSLEFPNLDFVDVARCFNIKELYRVLATDVRNIQLQKSMSFFESLVECTKTGMCMLIADAQ